MSASGDSSSSSSSSSSSDTSARRRRRRRRNRQRVAASKTAGAATNGTGNGGVGAPSSADLVNEQRLNSYQYFELGSSLESLFNANELATLATRSTTIVAPAAAAAAAPPVQPQQPISASAASSASSSSSSSSSGSEDSEADSTSTSNDQAATSSDEHIDEDEHDDDDTRNDDDADDSGGEDDEDDEEESDVEDDDDEDDCYDNEDGVDGRARASLDAIRDTLVAAASRRPLANMTNRWNDPNHRRSLLLCNGGDEINDAAAADQDEKLVTTKNVFLNLFSLIFNLNTSINSRLLFLIDFDTRRGKTSRLGKVSRLIFHTYCSSPYQRLQNGAKCKSGVLNYIADQSITFFKFFFYKSLVLTYSSMSTQLS